MYVVKSGLHYRSTASVTETIDDPIHSCCVYSFAVASVLSIAASMRLLLILKCTRDKVVFDSTLIVAAFDFKVPTIAPRRCP